MIQIDLFATRFNRVPKYVASRGTPALDWAGSTRHGPDLAAGVRALRDKHENVHVIGSLDLVQTLLRERSSTGAGGYSSSSSSRP